MNGQTLPRGTGSNPQQEPRLVTREISEGFGDPTARRRKVAQVGVKSISACSRLAGGSMRQITLYVLLSLAVCFAVASAQSVGATPVPLLPGYTHRSNGFGIDSAGGEIWKPYGPSISYQIGFAQGNGAAQYTQQFPTLPTIVQRTPQTNPFQVVMDEEHDIMMVRVDGADFRAQNVKSRLDVAEVLAIVRMVELNAERRH
jgi:hypothetical protein